MSLLDRFRTRPPHEHPDPEIRAEAVRQDIPAADQQLLAQIARSDPDARVRRAAVRKLADAEALGAALADPDLGVREEAGEVLVSQAAGQDLAAAELAIVRLTEPRHLAGLARSARLAPMRQAALSRLSDARGLAILARTATDSAVRLEALKRISDPALILEIASKSEHKDVAVAAVDRLEEKSALEAVAARSRNRAGSRRAQTRLAALRPPFVPTTTATSTDSVPEPTAVEAAAPDAVPAVETSLPESVRPEDRPPVTATTLTSTDGSDTVPSEARTAESPAPIHPPEPPDAPLSVDEAHAARARRETERREALNRMDALCAKLEGLVQAQGLTLKDSAEGLREAKLAQPLLAVVPGKLVQRFKVVRASLYAKMQELREADDWSRWSNATVQEELCRIMEALGGRDDMEKVARELRDADARWASARFAPRDQAETLRHRYQAARALVKAKLDAYFSKKMAEEAENLRQKEALCERAEGLSDSTDWMKAAEELKSLQATWKKVGPVPQRRSQAIWKRFRAACDKFFTRREADLRQRKEAWSANLTRKTELCVRAEALAESTDWDAALTEVRRLQADWKTIGPVQRNKSEAIWKRFRAACDAFFDRYKRRDALAEEARRAERETVIAELIALVPTGEETPPPIENLNEKLAGIQARFRQLSSTAGGDEEALTARFLVARNRVIEAYPDSFRGSDLDPRTSRVRKEKLCARVEALVADADAEATSADDLSGEQLARRLKEALATRTMGGAADAQARRRAVSEEVEAARATWKRLGPVPGEAGKELEKRFDEACARFLAKRRESGARRARSETAPGNP